MGINHFLLTRFNVPSPGVESLIRAEEDWLRERVGLFEQYCLPSVLAQTNRDFTWIIYFDPASPEWLRDRLAIHVEQGVFTPIYREDVSVVEDLVQDIRDLTDRKRDFLITTNLDNDDGLAVDFIDRVQSAATSHERVAIYVTNGLIRRSDGLYLHHYKRNAFNSVRESWASPVTSWSAWHTELGESMPVVEIGGSPGWLQVVHRSNVSNRVQGRLVSPLPYQKRFGRLLDGVAEPGAVDLACDRVVSRPVRLLRETGRAAGKRAVLGLLGREGLERVKVLWRSRLGLRQSLNVDSARPPSSGNEKAMRDHPRQNDLIM